MFKILWLPLLLAFACVVAGLYGIVHNQLSYTVSPAYFHEFKFNQFRVDPAYHNRLGAGIVGFMASWWMGILIGLPIYIAALFIKGRRQFVYTYACSALLVVVTTLCCGIAALAISVFTIGPDSLPDWMSGRDVSSPVAFARAGTMHNFSYLGGGVGLVIGLCYTVWQAWKSRRLATGQKV